jgi:hypothetical protein
VPAILMTIINKREVDLDFKAGVSDAEERLRDVLSSNASDQRIRHSGGASTSTLKRDFAADLLQVRQRALASTI